MSEPTITLTQPEAHLLAQYLDMQRQAITTMHAISERGPAVNAIRQKLLAPPAQKESPND